jgi:hypothetical protein
LAPTAEAMAHWKSFEFGLKDETPYFGLTDDSHPRKASSLKFRGNMEGKF